MNWKYLLAAIIFIFSFGQSEATHLMGGNLSYENVGFNVGLNQYEFKVTLVIYRLCDPGSSNLPASQDLGVYLENPANPTTKSRVASYTIPITSQQFIDPPNPGDSCSFVPNVCVEEGIYEITIFLDPTTTGYYLLSDRCCRNGNITNLDDPGAEGMVWYAFIPPTSTINSSPVWSVAPVPFICENDTISILNSAADPDGDVLTYELVHPFSGISGNGNPAPTPPLNYTFPIPTVVYPPFGGYTAATPFGTNGYASIDSLTGVTSYLAPATGFFVVAVEIKEYRNGVLVGISRRDIQLIVISCPINPAPVLSNSGGSGQTNYTITEGATLCFPITFTDPNGDSVYLNFNGGIFDSLLVNPPATLNQSQGNGTLTSQFCWTTSCNQGSPNPYIFSVSVDDNGCPAKTTNIAYSITVNPFMGSNINGPDTICQNNANAVNYNVPISAGSTVSWAIVGGTQVSGGTGNVIGVNFPNPGPATITAVETSVNGCPAPAVTKNVFIKASPAVNAGSDVTFCSGANSNIGVAPIPNQTYTWSPQTGLANPNFSSTGISISNPGANPASFPYVLTTTFDGCTNKDTAIVTVLPLPVANAGADKALCTGDTIGIGSNGVAGYIYSWTPPNGLLSTSIANPLVTLTNTGSTPITTTYNVNVTHTNGCMKADSMVLTVNPLPTVSSSASPNVICDGDATTLTGTGGSTYNWALSTNPGVSIGTGASINVSPSTTTTYVVTGTSSVGCKNTNQVTVTVNPLPIVTISPSTDTICEGDTATLSGTGASTYNWYELTTPSVVIGTGNSIDLSPIINTSYILEGTDANGCINKDTITVAVNPEPTIQNIVGIQSVCPGVSGVPYWLSPYNPNSTYQWVVVGGTIASGQNSDTVYVDWGLSGTANISVIETTTEGCPSDIISLPVTINVLLTPLAPAGDTVLCENTAANITYNTVFNTPGSVYNWFTQGGTIINGNGTNTVTVSWNLTGPAVGLLWFDEVSTTIDTVCFGTSDTLYVTINPLPNTSAITGPDKVCEGYEENFFEVISSNGSSYQWNATNGNVVNGNGTNIVNASWPAAGTQLIQVIETNIFGCVGTTVDKSIEVLPIPESDFGFDFTVGCEGITAQFNNQSVNATSYEWSFGDGGTSTEINPSHFFGFGQEANVSLIAINEFCPDTIIKIIPIQPLSDFIQEIPNVFTPNGDNKNDRFQLQNPIDFYACTTMKILNRWGNVIFESRPNVKFWNGRDNSNDVDMAPGLYFYIITVNDLEYKGTVHLLR